MGSWTQGSVVGGEKRVQERGGSINIQPAICNGYFPYP